MLLVEWEYSQLAGVAELVKAEDLRPSSKEHGFKSRLLHYFFIFI